MIAKSESEQTKLSTEDRHDLLCGRDKASRRKAAELVIEEFGEGAASHATARADVLYRAGDELGAAAWQWVTPMIEQLQKRRGYVGHD